MFARNNIGAFRSVGLPDRCLRFGVQREHLPAIGIDRSNGGGTTGPTVRFPVPMVGGRPVSGSLMARRLARPNGPVAIGGKVSASAGALRVGVANLGRLRDNHRQTATCAAHNAPTGRGVGRQCMPARTEEPQLHTGSVICRPG